MELKRGKINIPLEHKSFILAQMYMDFPPQLYRYYISLIFSSVPYLFASLHLPQLEIIDLSGLSLKSKLQEERNYVQFHPSTVFSGHSAMPTI